MTGTMDNPYQIELGRLLKASTITPGRYAPSPSIRTGKHIAVFDGHRPVILCGSADDEEPVVQETVRQATALAVSDLAKRILTSPEGSRGRLQVGVIDGRDISWAESLSAIVSKPSGQVVEPEDGDGPLVAILLNDPDFVRAPALCIMTETARAFDPSAPELDDGYTLSRLAKQEIS